VKDTKGLPTLKEVRKHLIEHHYTLLHIVAHGCFDKKENETFLYLLNDKEEVSPVATTDFLEQLDRIKRLPQLTFLSTCESASSEAEKTGALGGFAQRLVRELGIPSVIAMTDKNNHRHSYNFSHKFYKGYPLKAGHPINSMT
jgi:CHAT domain-containing protein